MIDWGKVLTSKTVWLGVLMILAACVEFYAGLPPGATWTQVVSGVLTIIIRFLTKDSLINGGK